MKTKIIILLTCICITIAGAVHTATASHAIKSFFDTVGHEAEKEIDVLAHYGIVRSRGGNEFAPDLSITRAEYADMIAKVSGISEAKYQNSYPDVDADDWYAGSLQGLYNAGFINSGMLEGGNFSGNTPLKRQEAAYLAMKAYKHITYKSGTAADVSVYTDFSSTDSWAQDAVKRALGMGFMTGVTGTEFQPHGEITRADAAMLVLRILDCKGNMDSHSFSGNDTSWSYIMRSIATTLNRENAIGSVSRITTDGNSANGCILYDLEYTGLGYPNCLQITHNYTGSILKNAITKGKSYHLSFYAKLEGGESLNVNAVHFSDTADRENYYTNIETTTIKGDGWNRYDLYFTATQTARNTKLWFWAGGDKKYNVKLYLDDFTVREYTPYVAVNTYYDKEFEGIANVTSDNFCKKDSDITLTANTKANSGYLFSGWRDEYGNPMSDNSVLKLTAYENIAYKADFSHYTAPSSGFEGAADGDEAETRIISFTKKSGEVSVLATVAVPDSMTLADTGVVFFDGDIKDGFDMFTPGAVVVRPQSLTMGTFSVSADADLFDKDIRAKSFAVAKDNNGYLYAVYSDVDFMKADEPETKKEYKLLYNHELLVAYVASYSNQPWNNNWKNAKEWFGKYVKDLDGTDVDLFMFCPGCWRATGWPSKVDPTIAGLTEADIANGDETVRRHVRTIQAGIDPVALTLQSAEEIGLDAFASFRVNDHHHTDDKNFNSHNNFWREHPEYWLLDSNSNTQSRLFNYMIPEVRNFYYSLIEEFLTLYDVEGIELDFQRYPRFFYTDEISRGTAVMTDYVGRIRTLLDRVGKERGKYLQLSVRVPESIENCASIGLDIPEWDRLGYIDIVNIGMFNVNSHEIDLESVLDNTSNSKVYAELHYTVHAAGSDNRFTTPEAYAAAAYDYLKRGADGISLFNIGWLKGDEQNVIPCFKGLTDINSLAAREKHYVFDTGSDKGGTHSKIFPITTSGKITLNIPDNTKNGYFEKALLRLEAESDCTSSEIEVCLNGEALEEVTNESVTLFDSPSADNFMPEIQEVKFYAVPLNLINQGKNTFEIIVISGSHGDLLGMELALYRGTNNMLLNYFDASFESGYNPADSGEGVYYSSADADDSLITCDGNSYVRLGGFDNSPANFVIKGVPVREGKTYIVAYDAMTEPGAASDFNAYVATGCQSVKSVDTSTSQLKSDGWTRVAAMYTCTESTDDAYFYVSAKNSSGAYPTALLVDNFEIYETDYDSSNMLAGNNPGFELGTAEGNITNGTATVIKGGADSNYCLKLSDRNASHIAGFRYVNKPLDEGAFYELSVDVKLAQPSDKKIKAGAYIELNGSSKNESLGIGHAQGESNRNRQSYKEIDSTRWTTIKRVYLMRFTDAEGIDNKIHFGVNFVDEKDADLSLDADILLDNFSLKKVGTVEKINNPSTAMEVSVAKYKEKTALNLNPLSDIDNLNIFVTKYNGSVLQDISIMNYEITADGRTIPINFSSEADLDGTVIYMWDGKILAPQSQAINLRKE